MKLTCERDKLSNLFGIVSSVTASSRTPKAILSNVKLEAHGDTVTLMATDLEVGVQVEMQNVAVTAPGAVMLPAKSVGAILRENSDAQITIENDGNKTVVRSDRSQFQLLTQDPAEFPALPRFEQSQYHEISSRFLREALRRTVFATDEESSRYALGGVLLELEEDSLTTVATDGRRMATQTGSATAVAGHSTVGATVVPTRSVHLIERILADADDTIRLAAMDNSVMLQGRSVTIFTRLVEGRYPRWRDIFPDTSQLIRVDMLVGPLLSAVRQAAILTEKDKPGVDFVFRQGRLELFSHGAELGDSEIEVPIAYDGEEVRMKLDPYLVLDFLKMLSLETTFAWYFRDGYTAAVSRTEDGYCYVVMPMAND